MPFIPPRSNSQALYRAAAESLQNMARQAEKLGADLCTDADFCERHLSSLQTIDRFAQHLDQIANVISADDPLLAVEEVKLSELKDHLDQAAWTPWQDIEETRINLP